MEWIVEPVHRFSGTVIVPADKSITHRAIMFAALAEGESTVENYLPAEDCMATQSSAGR